MSGASNEAAPSSSTCRGSTMAWPLAARAQQPPVVGYLGLTSQSEPTPTTWRRSAKRLARRVLTMAAMSISSPVLLKATSVDCRGLPPNSSVAMWRLFSLPRQSQPLLPRPRPRIPVVFAIGADPIKSGLVTSLNRPGGNLTGISFFTNQMESKRLGLLHELAPKVDLIAAPLNPNNPFFDNQLKDVGEASRALNLKVQIERASNQRDIASPSRSSRN